MRGIVRRISIAFSLIAAMSGPACAGSVTDLPSIIVPIAGQDFATEAGNEGLTQILRSAARGVCEQEYRRDGYLFMHACFVAALQDALEQLNRLRAGRVTSLTGAPIVVGARQ
jgi:UrcA family protein